MDTSKRNSKRRRLSVKKYKLRKNERRLHVFLAYKPLFVGRNARARRVKVIREILNNNEKSAPVVQKELGLERVISILKFLLQKEVFSNKSKAKSMFPELYETSTKPSVRHASSNTKAARSKAKNLREAQVQEGTEILNVMDDLGSKLRVSRQETESESDESSCESGESSCESDESSCELANEDQEETQDEENEVEVQRTSTDTKNIVPSLYPAKFQFKIQHAILAKIQTVLEECCYEFSFKHIPELMKKAEWSCPEAIELTKWTVAINKHLKEKPIAGLKTSSSNFRSILLSVNKLRHSAVHRVPVSGNGILTMTSNAIAFAEALGDPLRAQQLVKFKKELVAKIEHQEIHKNHFEARLKEALGKIERKRKMLDKEEEGAIQAALVEDEQNTMYVGSLLEESLKAIQK